MQRRNVDLPDPDGPITHITSPGATSRSMPLSTLSWPNDLQTLSAFTIGTWAPAACCTALNASLPPSALGVLPVAAGSPVIRSRG